MTLPRKITAGRLAHPPSSSKGKYAIEDVPEEDVDEQMNDAEEERTASDNDNSGSDENFEGSDNDDEDENEEVASDPTPFIGLDVSKIKSERYTVLRHINQFRFPRDATMGMFHTMFQQNIYHIIYAQKKFANHRFVKWSYLGQNQVYNGLFRLFRRVGLDSLVSLSCNFHAKVIKQFYATVFVSPEHDHLI